MKGGYYDTLEFYAGPGRSLQVGIDCGPRPGLRNDAVFILSPPEMFVSSISSGVTMERSLQSVRIPDLNNVLARCLGMLAAESSNEKLFIQVYQQKARPKNIQRTRSRSFRARYCSHFCKLISRSGEL
jgi:hypothetical protein